MSVQSPYLGWDALWGLDADAGVPFARGQHGDLIQELVDPRQQVVPVFGLVGDVMENLQMTELESV